MQLKANLWVSSKALSCKGRTHLSSPTKLAIYSSQIADRLEKTFLHTRAEVFLWLTCSKKASVQSHWNASVVQQALLSAMRKKSFTCLRLARTACCDFFTLQKESTTWGNNSLMQCLSSVQWALRTDCHFGHANETYCCRAVRVQKHVRWWFSWVSQRGRWVYPQTKTSTMWTWD